MNALGAIAGRDLRLVFRAGGGAAQTLIFFGAAALIFALALGPDPNRLAPLAAPILWSLALLSTLISLDRLFEADLEDGSFDAIVETAEFLEFAILAKALAHWAGSSLPVLLAAPLVAVLLNLPPEGLLPLMGSLLVGTPALSLFGAVGAAVGAGMRRAGVFVAVLAAPLFLPTLIFGVEAAAGAENPGSAASFLLLGAVTLISAVVGPVAAAAAIRFNMR